MILTDAKLFYGGYDFSGVHNECSVDYASEMQDVTTFGDDTRKNTGGLTTASMSGSGLWRGGTRNIDDIIFNQVGSDIEPLAVFATLTEGERGGYAMKAVIENYNIGTGVGSMLTFDLSAQGRGIK